MNMSEIDLTLSRRPLRGELRINQAMKKYTSWRAGGQAERLYIPADLADFAEFLRGLPPDSQVSSQPSYQRPSIRIHPIRVGPSVGGAASQMA